MWSPWKTHWALALVKGISEPHEVKKKNYLNLGGNRTYDLRIRSTVTLPTELRGRTEIVGDGLGGELRRRESKGTYECCAAWHYEKNVVKMVLSNNQMWRFWLYQIAKNTGLVLSNNQCETRLVLSNNQEKQNWFYQIAKGNKTGYMK